MFTFFLHESMNPFHQTVTSFPTVIYSGLLIICLLYWLVAVFGLVDLDILDMDLDGDVDGADSASAQTGIAGLLMKFGLGGVPLTITISLIALFGWLLCYYSSYFARSILPEGILLSLAGLAIFVAATFVSVMLTAQLIKPVRAFFQKLEIDETKHILGQTVTVRSSTVTESTGEGLMDDGGAGILLNIRSAAGESFVKGDQVVVIERLSDQNLYRVVSEAEFRG